MAKSKVDEEIAKVRAAALRGMEKATTQWEADTKAITHVDTGALRRSWTHAVEESGSKIYGVCGSNLAYAQAEDDYHGNLSTALNSNVKNYFDTIAEEIKQAK